MEQRIINMEKDVLRLGDNKIFLDVLPHAALPATFPLLSCLCLGCCAAISPSHTLDPIFPMRLEFIV